MTRGSVFGVIARLLLAGTLVTSMGQAPAAARAAIDPSGADAWASGASSGSQAAESGIAADWSASVPMESGRLDIKAVASDADGVYLVGTTGGVAAGESSAGWEDVVVARLEPEDGSPIWVTQFGTAEYDRGFDVLVTPAGVYVGGSTNGSLEPGVPALADSPFVAKLTFGGSIAWIRQGPRRATPWRLAAAPDGGAYVASTADVSSDPSRSAGQVRRYAPDGDLTWEREITACCQLGSFGNVEIRSIASDPGGGLVVGGWSFGSITGGIDTVERGFVQLWTLRGQLLWTRELEASWGAVSLAAITVNHAGIVATGTSQGHLPDLPDDQAADNPWYRRYDFDGHLELTLPKTRKTLDSDCSGVLATFETSSPQSGLPGGALERLTTSGAVSWRFDREATSTTYHVFYDVSRTGARAYLVEETGEDGAVDTHITAISGLPDPGGCDMTAPNATAPQPRIIVNSLLNGDVAVRLLWSATDDRGAVARYRLHGRIDGAAPTLIGDELVTPAKVVILKPGHRYRYQVEAVDHAGNVGSVWSPWFDVRSRDDRSSAVNYTGNWDRRSDTDAADGTLTTTTDAGATATFVVTGRSIAWVGTRGRKAGVARVSVDGHAVATVDLHLAHRQLQTIVWRMSWPSSGTHRVTIRVLDSKRHRVDVDAVVAVD